MQPAFGDYSENFGAELLCPSCNFNYLHHDRVEVFECGEDADFGVHVIVSDGKATMDTSLDGNPSSRCHGLKIHFWCEGCSAKPVLSLFQHKGTTFINFDT